MGKKLGGFAGGRIWAAVAVCVASALGPLGLAAQQPPPSDADTTISEAEEHFRMGVTLYRQGNFREALDEFNRALALDPDFEDAKQFRADTEAQLNLSEAGVNPTERPAFETFEPEAIGPPEESPQLSPEEFKIQRVRELLDLAERYLEYQFYEEAVDYFEQVLLIAPDNDRAQQGLHDATLGLYRQRIDETQGQVDEQIGRMRVDMEEMKLLPEGADPRGIRNPRIDVPRVEERAQAVEERSYIEEILDNPVGVVFEDIHLLDILDFITDTYEVNIIVDNRVVAPPEEEQAPGPGAPPGRPGARPGAQPGGGGNLGAGINAFAGAAAQRRGQGENQYVTDGMISYINLKNVTLRNALKAFLRPLNLDFAVQESFIWISTPEKIRIESFEDLETRFYELQNAGAETLFKLVLSPEEFGRGQTLAVGGGVQAGAGAGGGPGGGGGGLGGGGGGGAGGGGGGLGGGGGGGGLGGGGGGGGGLGGGGGGGGQGGQGAGFTNISELFDTIADTDVGEFPNPFSQIGGGGAGGLGGGGGGFGAGGGATGAFGAGGGPGGGAGTQFVGGPGPGLGAAAGFLGESQAIQIIRHLVPPVIEPFSQRLLSFMRYNLVTNQLVVHTTPSRHRIIEELLANLDKTPKQVAIEAKFLTVSVNDQEKVGFDWNLLVSDLNNRARGPLTPTQTDSGNPVFPPGVVNPPGVDLDGDGEPDTGGQINGRTGGVAPPFNNTVSFIDLVNGIVNPGPPGNFRLVGSIFDNADGDQLRVAFEFLDSVGETELLSAPRVTTMNQKPAVIADITEEFFLVGVQTDAQVVTATGGDNAGTVINTFQTQILESFIFGFTLSVTPQIADNQVRLWLNPQVTNRQGVSEFTIQNNVGGATNENTIAIPIVRTQSVWTNVVVNDGDTLVLGGLVTDRTEKNETRFPYLADIPVLGFFFRGKSREVSQSSLLIFVTPTIIDPSGARSFEPSI